MRSIERSQSSKQSGFMAVLFLILLGLFLTFAAFALDLGNYYLWQLRLDKMARAGALAGVARRGLDGYNNSQNGYSIKQAVAASVRDNFRAHGVPDTSIPAPVTTYDPTTETVQVSVTHAIPLILMDKIMRFFTYGFSRSDQAAQDTTISAIQRATLAPANVVLMLDVSGSMLCPAIDNNNCACRSQGPTACAALGLSKLDLMAQGVNIFAGMFNPNRDRVAVIPFNLAAQRLFSLTSGSNAVTMSNASANNGQFGGASAWNFLTSPTLAANLQTLAGSNTNHCDALAEGILELENLSSVLFGATGVGTARQQLQPFVVFFTDGAPNAMRGIFDDNAGQRQCQTYTGSYSGTRKPCEQFPVANNTDSMDMYHYALEWVASDGGTLKQYRGPGPFVVRTLNNGIPTVFKHPISSSKVAPDASVTCGEHSPDPVEFEKTITRVQSNTVAGTFGDSNKGCLRPTGDAPTFSFSIPYTNKGASETDTSTTYKARVQSPIANIRSALRDPDWPSRYYTSLPAGTPIDIQKYDELPYYCAIEAADYLRTRFGATIFAIGLGPGSRAVGSGCNDPLQDADDHVSRKDYFLSRLAFSRQMFTDPAIPVQMDRNYAFKISGAPTAINYLSCDRHRFGTSFNPGLLLGYYSRSGLVDGDNTFRELRPQRPGWADGVVKADGDVGRRVNTQGEYFPTNNPQEVPAIFGNIAKSILLRAAS